MMDEATRLWTPDPERVAGSNLARFRAFAGREGDGYDALHDWSVAEPEAFWTAVWDFCEVIAETRGERVLVDGGDLKAAAFFPDARLNFAQNLLRRRDDAPALIFRAEDRFAERMSWRELHDLVSRLHRALHAMGVRQGDRVAGFMPNMPETVAAMLAAASLGAVWSSCSPDFGVRGVLDRFGQIGPKVLFAADGYVYGGKEHDSLERVGGILAELPEIERAVIVPLLNDRPDISGLEGRAALLDDVIAEHEAGEIEYVMTGFNDPLYIMYSSGTTGLPKCILHGAGGTLLQHLKEHRLQVDVHPVDRLFYFTTCGWMMWNWLVSGLASEATLLLYDGSPFHPDANAVFDFIEAEKGEIFGTSAKFIDACAKEGVRPAETHDLSAVKTILSTGSPLAPAGFDHVYRDWKADVQLASIAGGTDILGCFVGGAPTEPVWRGEIQKPQLGLDVRVLDEEGRPVTGEQGELCCMNAHPSMPLGFWNDPDGSRYHEAYFDRYENVWRHGDWVMMTERRGLVIYGRSDATLNPGGVRIGTAEIYRQVEALPDVLEALVIGQDWQDDVRIVLFVRLAAGARLDEALEDRIRNQIRRNATPRHVPAKIVAVADIPRTLSGKIVELAVRNVVHGRPVKNRDALANPEALELFRDLPELRT
jgi:acetoacetyl-CoA synthetase